MGETLIGLGDDSYADSVDDREHTNPQAYVMNKH